MARKMKTMDGNNAAAWVSYPFTDLAAIYPITPSSPMAEVTDQWSAKDKKNLFGQPVQVVEMQSEAGAAGAVHGSLSAGALTTTYTASQGLLLMIPNMYKIAGELLPSVIHVSARCVSITRSEHFRRSFRCIWHAVRQAMLCFVLQTAQEVMDLGAVAHLSSYQGKSSVSFISLTVSEHLTRSRRSNTWDDADLKEMLDMEAVDRFRKHALNPEHPVLRGTAQNPDIFFQAREACNPVL